MMKLPRLHSAPLVLSAVLALTAMVGACGGDDDGDAILEPGPVASVTITAPTTEIRIGQSVQLTATARDANGTELEREFTWISGIGTVASVSSTGLVTGLVKGQSEIRATTEDVTGSIVITVNVAPPPE